MVCLFHTIHILNPHIKSIKIKFDLELIDKLEVLRLEIAKAIATIEAGLNTELVEIEKLFYLKKTPVNRLN